jgi:VHL beta domain
MPSTFTRLRLVRVSSIAAALVALSATTASADSSCNGLFKTKSKNSDTATSITFVNKSQTQRGIMWLDFKGQPQDYATIAPGKSVTLQTFLTHPWMVTTGPGDCLQIVMPSAGGSTFKLTEKGASSGEEGDTQTSCPPGTVPVPETDNCVKPKKKQAGCWYALYACSSSKKTDGPGFTVKSDDYPGFEISNQYCNIGGPFNTKADAKTQVDRFGGQLKQSCE